MSDYSSNDKPLDWIKAEIYDFPINIICLEKLENTLDSLLEVENEDDELSMDGCTACNCS